MATKVRYIKDSPEFSDEEREWARQVREMSEYKYAVDLQSKIVDARREGMAEVVRNLLKTDMPVEQIASLTGLTIEDVKSLRS